MYQTFIQVYIFFLLINGAIFLGEELLPQFPITNPFDQTKTVTPINPQSLNIYNATNNTGTISNAIQHPKNSTSGSPFNWFTDWFNITLAVVQSIFGILFGTFIGDVLIYFGFPWAFIVLVYAVQGVFLIVTAIYYLTGKGL